MPYLTNPRSMFPHYISGKFKMKSDSRFLLILPDTSFVYKILDYPVGAVDCTCLSTWLYNDGPASWSAETSKVNNHFASLCQCRSSVLIYRLHPPRQSSLAAPLVWGSGQASSSPSPAPWCWYSHPQRLGQRCQRRPWTLQRPWQHMGETSQLINKYGPGQGEPHYDNNAGTPCIKCRWFYNQLMRYTWWHLVHASRTILIYAPFFCSSVSCSTCKK